jgi:hypothetical protein
LNHIRLLRYLGASFGNNSKKGRDQAAEQQANNDLVLQVRDSFRWPGSICAVREVHAICLENWQAYVSGDVKQMSSNGMLYPITVSQSGRLRPHTVSGCFPDTKAPIIPDGKLSTSLPPLLLT